MRTFLKVFEFYREVFKFHENFQVFQCLFSRKITIVAQPSGVRFNTKIKSSKTWKWRYDVKRNSNVFPLETGIFIWFYTHKRRDEMKEKRQFERGSVGVSLTIQLTNTCNCCFTRSCLKSNMIFLRGIQNQTTKKKLCKLSITVSCAEIVIAARSKSALLLLLASSTKSDTFHIFKIP